MFVRNGNLQGGPKRLSARFVVVLVLWALSAAVSAVPVAISDTFNFREFRYDPPPQFFQGPDLFLLGARVDVLSGTTVTATNSNTGLFSGFTDISPGGFGADVTFFVPYSTATAAGAWTITATNGSDVSSAAVAAFGTGSGTGILPGVGDLSVSGILNAPTLTWTLPAGLASANSGNVDRLRVRIQDLSTGGTLFDSKSDLNQNLALSLTSYNVPGGFITAPGNYTAEVLVEGFNPFDRSRTYVSFTVPEPSILLLLGSGLLGFVLARGHRRHIA